MIEARVVHLDGETHVGWGHNEFNELPRIGEFIHKLDDNDVGQSYKVVAVFHRVPATPTSIPDIYVVHVGSVNDHLTSLEALAGGKRRDDPQRDSKTAEEKRAEEMELRRKESAMPLPVFVR